MPVPSRGLLLVYTQPGHAVPSSEYEQWHDTEHVWPLLNLPGPLFLSATRWTAADTKTPCHLATYDLASLSAVYDPAYTALLEAEPELDYVSDSTSEEWDSGVADASGKGRTAGVWNGMRDFLPDKLEVMERRVYEPLADESRATRFAPVQDVSQSQGGSDGDENEYQGPTEPGKYMTVVEVEMMKYAEAEFNRWFDEEHIPLLARVPGWVRSRRFVLKEVLGVSGTSVGWDGVRGETGSERARKRVAGCGRGREVKEERPPKYLALHEWMSVDAFRTKEFKRATTTPWRTQVLKDDRVIKYEIRVFKVARNWQRL